MLLCRRTQTSRMSQASANRNEGPQQLRCNHAMRCKRKGRKRQFSSRHRDTIGSQTKKQEETKLREDRIRVYVDGCSTTACSGWDQVDGLQHNQKMHVEMTWHNTLSSSGTARACSYRVTTLPARSVGVLYVIHCELGCGQGSNNMQQLAWRPNATSRECCCLTHGAALAPHVQAAQPVSMHDETPVTCSCVTKPTFSTHDHSMFCNSACSALRARSHPSQPVLAAANNPAALSLPPAVSMQRVAAPCVPSHSTRISETLRRAAPAPGPAAAPPPVHFLMAAAARTAGRERAAGRYSRLGGRQHRAAAAWRGSGTPPRPPAPHLLRRAPAERRTT